MRRRNRGKEEEMGWGGQEEVNPAKGARASGKKVTSKLLFSFVLVVFIIFFLFCTSQEYFIFSASLLCF